jgi:hypothetical protein
MTDQRPSWNDVTVARKRMFRQEFCTKIGKTPDMRCEILLGVTSGETKTTCLVAKSPRAIETDRDLSDHTMTVCCAAAK